MRAPVVPTHGWPKDTAEVREPNWAWRAVMARDQRPDSTLPPRIDRRWTPVDLPVDPLDPSEGAWHAKAARRMAFGRVFATAPNVGIVTFAPTGDTWSVRHIIAGELFPIPDTGNSPTGLQPYIVHEFALAPVPTTTWDTSRPKITDDGGWAWIRRSRSSSCCSSSCHQFGSSPPTLAARCSTTFPRFSTTSRGKRS
jgi:hypothetical protein